MHFKYTKGGKYPLCIQTFNKKNLYPGFFLNIVFIYHPSYLMNEVNPWEIDFYNLNCNKK